MTYIFDEDSANTAVAEERKYQSEFNKEHNRIMSMIPGERKTRLYRELHGIRLAVEGLTEEELTRPY